MMLFLSVFFFTDTDASQDSKGKQGTIFRSLSHFHEHSDIDSQFCIMFNIYKHLCVSGIQKYTMTVLYNVHITKKFLVGAKGSEKGDSREALLTQPLLFQFLMFPLKSNYSRNTVGRYSMLI